ncbi:pimeloyl-ACP methyl ester carboxylesterase [Actinoplanes campanulatus]|uniref:Pimeloyl-ACP methyl ester carboxylesterase n=1 Tax=Actinoplanes campanulatus TaxID=113559 RepID=A0A7W5FJ87_9ACTN|nr:alpha/beta hydrolase [Actinoplanes campanulatus]MBB3100240.1 pimeloyl-ACP methyl ester carboxylesterase [Actinoplanes campanulatus]GGN44263.1 alpha/beta hydrolase [Actinoplanes campanulatus]GID40957.1 alpha/beta hydrolase [Actinoplanes campanulatus]
MGWWKRYHDDMVAAQRRLANPPVPVADFRSTHGMIRFARFGTGRAVLVLHGSGGGWDQGVDWAQRRLTSNHTDGYDVISPSRFGYPGSPLPDGASVSDQAAALTELLDHLGVDQADVVGLSAGTVAALQLAADHPRRVRRLVLESPLLPVAGRAPLPPVPVVRVLARAQFLLWLTTKIPAVVKLAAGAPPARLAKDDLDELNAINATMFPLGPRRAGTVHDRATVARHALADRIPVSEITAPALIINAAHALLAPHDDVERFSARLRDARTLELDHGGHVLIGNVETLRQAVTGFLDA